jgi:hypothetical protein
MWSTGEEVSERAYTHLYKLWCVLDRDHNARHATSWQKLYHVPWGTGKHPLRRETLLDRPPLRVHPNGLRANGLDEGRTPVHLWRGVSEHRKMWCALQTFEKAVRNMWINVFAKAHEQDISRLQIDIWLSCRVFYEAL